MARLDIENLGKCHAGPRGREVWALRQASLQVDEGELVVLLGPSGAGKSTLLRLVAGLDAPTEGAVQIGGRDMRGVEPGDRDVAMVFQSHALYPHLSVHDNLALGLVLRRRPAAEIRARILEAARLLDLQACLDRKPADLSGGERQRVALGRALVRRPGVFLLDEPFSDLDAPRRARLREEILKLPGRMGAALLHVTHDQAEALALGGRIAVLKEGLVQQVALPATLYDQPANLFVAGFVGTPSMNLLRGRLATRGQTTVFETEAGSEGTPVLRFVLSAAQVAGLGRQAGREVICGVRPEHLECLPGEAGTPADNGASVERVEFAAAGTHLHLRAGNLTLVARSSSRAERPPGQRLSLAVPARHLRFFEPGTGRAISLPGA